MGELRAVVVTNGLGEGIHAYIENSDGVVLGELAVCGWKLRQDVGDLAVLTLDTISYRFENEWHLPHDEKCGCNP